MVAGAHSRARVIEDYVSALEAPGLTNAVTEIFAGEGADLEHVKIQRESLAALHVATIEARQRAGSRVLSHSISWALIWPAPRLTCASKAKDATAS